MMMAASPMTLGAFSGLDPALQLMILTGSLTLLPFMVASMTSFMRYVIVFSILKQAMGTQQVPPALVLVGFSIILTFYTMSPVFTQIYDAVNPIMSSPKADIVQILERGSIPLKQFMMRQTREDDIRVFLEVSRKKAPKSVNELSIWEITPAFMLSELRTAFEIGFVIFIPFVVIDLVVANILMALGMMMLSPTIISLPFKILIFIAVDGWSIIVRGLIQSFN
jgi:flagellar biosynthesis protein FliP